MNYEWTDLRVAIVKRMLKEGSSIEEVAIALDVNLKNLKTYCYAHFIKFPTAVRHPTIVIDGVCKRCKTKFSRRVSVLSPKPKYCSQKCSSAACSKVKK
jgi:hypothetical protein